ncbi:hypothetical protein HYW46_03375 [Candidatus Daviesbacteria bacterium]|nr:hypothetical protein [Candidatus Daviesbacteria bacterium]
MKNTIIKLNVIRIIFKDPMLGLPILLSLIALVSFTYFYINGLGLSYNDARSHLDIGRRVVEGLKPGIAQLGSVWLPLPHVLMIPFVWNDFLWHSGLAGALTSMVSFVATGIFIYLILKKLGIGILGRLVAVGLFASNLNMLYLQSTAMTEPLLIATTTAAIYSFIVWEKEEKIIDLIKSAFWVMMASLTRYDGWFLFLLIASAVMVNIFIKSQGKITQNLKEKYQKAEGLMILFATLAGFGILLWFLWNQLIFKDALYFAYGPYSARVQQAQLEQAGNLVTKGNILYSASAYLYALVYNVGAFIAVLGLIGAVILWIDKKIALNVKIAASMLTTPLIFNIAALYFGHSVLFIQGISGETWFNVRYGALMVVPAAIFVGFLIDRLKDLRLVLIGLLLFVTFFQFNSLDAVTIDDARVGSSQKNVSEVSGWLNQNAKDKDGFVLISVASHDAIVFSSGLPMSKFIHEGTGAYWDLATTNPSHWARWIVMRTYDDKDMVYKAVSKTKELDHYDLVAKYPFADVYKLQEQYVSNLITRPILGKQK